MPAPLSCALLLHSPAAPRFWGLYVWWCQHCVPVPSFQEPGQEQGNKATRRRATSRQRTQRPSAEKCLHPDDLHGPVLLFTQKSSLLAVFSWESPGNSVSRTFRETQVCHNLLCTLPHLWDVYNIEYSVNGVQVGSKQHHPGKGDEKANLPMLGQMKCFFLRLFSFRS